MNFALTAYRGTGKDTFCKALKGEISLTRLEWNVYSKTGAIFPFPIKKIQRIALADELKYIVCDRLLIPRMFVDSGEFDKVKDTREVEGKTLRRWCIDIGRQLKEDHGKLFFVEKIREQVDDNSCQWVLTDCRYGFEVLPGWITIKLFRKEVPVADISEDSERSMDSYPCDFLLVKDQQDFEAVQKYSPHYKDYVYLGVI